MNKEILKIIDLTSQGQGIAKTKDGKVTFIRHVVPGDRIKADLIPYKKNIWQTENIELVEQSVDRIEPLCPYFNDSLSLEKPGCGGCQIQQIPYDTLADIKEKQIYDQLERIAKLNLADISCEKIIKAEDPWHYRNHIQLKFSYDEKQQKFIKGFYAEQSHEIVEHESCYIAPKVETLIWQKIEMYLDTTKYVKVFKCHFKELIIRLGVHTGQLLIAFHFDSIPSELQKDMEKLKNEIAELADAINQNLDQQKVMSFYLIEQNKQQIHLWGKPYFIEKILGKQFQIYPQSFFQVNTSQAERLIQAVLADVNKLENNKDKLGTVYDLYCGTGVIGILLSEYFEQIKGVEISADAIQNAKENAALNQVKSFEFEQGKTEDWLLKQVIKKQDFIVVDPPRKGLASKLIETLNKIEAQNLIYVSCNPATLARDIEMLSSKWQVKTIQPLDLFPWTMHVESVALLSKLDVDQHIKVKLDMDELDVTASESRATYEEIKDYVLNKHDMKVSNLYISQIKKKCGLEVGKNYNVSKKENPIVPNCPPEKEEAIKEALKNFKMI